MCSPFHRFAASSRRSTSGAFTFTTIFESKSRPGVHVEVRVCRTGEAVRAGMRASSIRVDRPVERQGAAGHAVDDRLRLGLDERDAPELRRVEGLPARSRRAGPWTDQDRTYVRFWLARSVGGVDPLSELRQHRHRDIRLFLEQLLEVHPRDREAAHRCLGPDARVPRVIGEERELAEELPRSQLPGPPVRASAPRRSPPRARTSPSPADPPRPAPSPRAPRTRSTARRCAARCDRAGPRRAGSPGACRCPSR